MGRLRKVTDGDFSDFINEGRDRFVVLAFSSSWCEENGVRESLEALATNHDGRIQTGRMDVDSSPATASRYNVRALPAVLIFQNGQQVATLVGDEAKRLEAVVDAIMDGS